MWQRLLAFLKLLLGGAPPVTPPSPPPVPVPPPVPPPVVPPVAPPVAPPIVPPDDACPRPDGIKLGWRDTRKLEKGWRNQFNVTPLVGGVPASEGCGETYFLRYGEPQAFQDGPGFTGDPVERASGDSFGDILVIATNDESQWDGPIYKPNGPMTIGVSYPWLKTWRCQNGVMGTDGQMRGFGNNSQGYDKAK